MNKQTVLHHIMEYHLAVKRNEVLIHMYEPHPLQREERELIYLFLATPRGVQDLSFLTRD